MRILSYNELETALKNTFKPITNFTTAYNDYYKDLYYTGCRPNELLDIKLFSYSTIDPEKIILKPFKKNNSRTFELSAFSQNFQNAFLGDYKPYFPLTSWRVTYGFKYFFPLSQTYVKTKPIDLYLFRYFKVKTLFKQGVSVAEIQSIFGWKHDFLPARYGNAEIKLL